MDTNIITQTDNINIWPLDYKTSFMLNSAEHEICSANKSQIINNCKFFLDKHSWAWKFLRI